MPVLQVDAHFTVIESTLKGYLKWKRYNQQAPVCFLWVIVNRRLLISQRHSKLQNLKAT